MSNDERFIVTDRYRALGIPYPEPETVCHGQCEGMGWVPVTENDDEERFRAAWKAAHVAAGEHDCDGFHFAKCPDCNGTGKRS